LVFRVALIIKSF